jgi:tetratricopeptide (TPR) repeat protein
MAECYEKLNKNNQAILAYKRIIELDNEYEDAYERLIILYKKEGKLDKLTEEWEKKTKVLENPTMQKYLDTLLKDK